MVVKASAEITLSYIIDVKATYRYYLLQSSTTAWPSKPTTYPPSSSWDDTEPSYTEGSTNSLYFVDCTVFNDNSFKYSEVSKSTSYEAAKAAYNKATAAQTLANNAKLAVDSLSGTVTSQAETITTHGTKISTLEQTAQGFSISLETLEADAIVSTQEQFYNSDSPTSLTGGSWSDDQSTWTEGKYIWRRTLVTYGDGSTDYTPSPSGVCITGNTGAQGAAGSSIWTTTTAPTTPNYTFTISKLTGGNGTAIKVGDVIKYSYYMYTVTSVSSTTVLAPTRVSIRGSTGASGKWYSGTAITGTSTTATIFSGSGISSAIVGDMYLNTSTSNTYRCTTAGAASAAKWVYVANIQGEDGPQGDPGEDGRMLYATCSTAATTAAKVATLSNGTLTLSAGATVSVKFTYANNVSTPTLNVASTGAKTIRLNNAAITNSAYYWPANATITFVYDGTYWNVSDAGSLYKANEASKTASNYMSYDSTNGLVVGNKTSGSWSGFRTQITSDSFNILNVDGSPMAEYGANTIKLGTDAEESTIDFCGGGAVLEYDADDGCIDLTGDEIRVRGTSSASLYMGYIDDSNNSYVAHKSSFVADPNGLTMYAGKSVPMETPWQTATWTSSELDVQPDGIRARAAYDLEVRSGTDMSIDSSYGDININAAFGIVQLKAGGGAVCLGPTAIDRVWVNSSLKFPAGKHIYGTNYSGDERALIQYNSDNSTNQLFFGNGGYANNEGSSWFDGNEVYIRSKNAIKFTSVTAGLTSREYGVNKVLWSGDLYMTNAQPISLTEAVSAQPNGIILVFSSCINGVATDAHFVTFFVPKEHVAAHPGAGSVFQMRRHMTAYITTKYLYINDSSIAGHADNNKTSDTATVDFNNTYFSLRAVYGV